MDGDVALRALVLIAVLAAGYVTTLKFREDRRIRDLALWLRRTYPARWDTLPWIQRTADRLAAVETFRRDPDFDDPEFDRRYARAKAMRREQAIGLGVACAAMLLAAAGHQFLGWRV